MTDGLRQRLRRLPGRRAWALARLWVAGGEHREAAVAEALRPRNLFQPFTTTTRDRYPEEVECIAETCVTSAPVRILSFGCASGAELLTLRERFPGARIVGIDINPLAVRRARRAVRGTGIVVRRAGDAAGEPAASYDVVLAMAVFRHGALNSGPPSCDAVIRYADFDRTVTGLCRAVAPGGLLAIRHANFRFTDTAASRDFEPVRVGFPSESDAGEPTPVYGPDDRLLPSGCRDDGIYRRLSAGGPRTDQPVRP